MSNPRTRCIRPPTVAELPLLQKIEQRAGDLLQGHPAYAVFAAHALPLASLQEGLAAGRLWLVVAGGEVAGYLLGGVLDGDFHVLQMDVDPAHARRGHGRALLRHACTQARRHGFGHAVLTTLRDVPWNAPFYASEGFRELGEAQWGEGLRQTMAEERALGFPMALRVALRKPLL
ncbi:GNAT family N-acetyltransferase [Flavobacterium sp. MXW15]|uniref:GNAT family N-acetyltransferase n=1 Tax=Xanthomonas chitinilytica TaxID=2989819 RepID=A0ABT3JTA8_9XANT|nr:GNAT family N-acetyltransferase [Xanthomonas sp. H13-6]MCW4454483.1 GNAT family N-acetyltransferase [Flavobacterium sp. MXW15]MCW4471723.1 GNAT family N-acetyltransferase [Xanthomonas sp. H13-6]